MEVINMRKNCGIFVGMNNKTIKKNLIEIFSLKALAEEPNSDVDNGDDDAGNTPNTTINYEDLIAKARKEEKEKQYKTIDKLKGQIATLTEQHNSDLLVVAGLKEDLAKAEAKLSTAGTSDSEEVKTLKAELKTAQDSIATLTAENEGFKNQTPVNREEVEAEIRAELEKEYEVKTYKAEKLAELKDDILVPELVFGNTKEEIDNSIQSALERSASIRKSLGLDEDGKKPQKRTPKSVSNPSVSGVQDKEISMEYLASLDVSSKEYAEVRKKLGLK